MPDDDDVLLCFDLSVRLSACLSVSVSPHSLRSCFTHSAPSPCHLAQSSPAYVGQRSAYFVTFYSLQATQSESCREGERNAFYFFHATFYFLLLSLCFGFQWVASAAVSVMRESFTRPSDIPVLRGTTARCLFAFSSVRFPLLPLLL